MKLILVLNICILPGMVFSQNLVPQSQRTITFIADSLFTNGEFGKAESQYYKLMTFNQNVDWTNWFSAFAGFRKCKVNQGEIDAIIQEIGNVMKNCFIINSEVKGKMYFYLGFYHGKKGELLNSIDSYKKAINYLEDCISVNDEILNFKYYNFMNLSLNYSILGDQISAISYCKRAFEIAEKLNSNDKLCEIILNQSKFHLYGGNVHEAISILSKNKGFCKSSYWKSYVYQYLAENHIINNELETGKTYLDKSFELFDKRDYDFYLILAKYHFEIGDYEGAETQFLKALDKLTIDSGKRLIPKIKVNYANFLVERGDLEKAVRIAHESVQIYFEDVDLKDLMSRPNYSY